MTLFEPVTIAACQDHLRAHGTGVSLDLASMPKPADGYAAFRATLEDGDVDRIFLWFEFQKHTKNRSGKLTEALPEFINEKRIRQLVEGDKAKGWGPIDLRTASRFEPETGRDALILRRQPATGGSRSRRRPLREEQ